MPELSKEIRDYMSSLGKKGGATMTPLRKERYKTRRNNGGRPLGSKNKKERGNV